jgi:hypothetical protein
LTLPLVRRPDIRDYAPAVHTCRMICPMKRDGVEGHQIWMVEATPRFFFNCSAAAPKWRCVTVQGIKERDITRLRKECEGHCRLLRRAPRFGPKHLPPVSPAGTLDVDISTPLNTQSPGDIWDSETRILGNGTGPWPEYPTLTSPATRQRRPPIEMGTGWLTDRRKDIQGLPIELSA